MTRPRGPLFPAPPTRSLRQPSLRVHIWNREAIPSPPVGEDVVDRTGAGYPTPRRYEEEDGPKE